MQVGAEMESQMSFPTVLATRRLRRKGRLLALELSLELLLVS